MKFKKSASIGLAAMSLAGVGAAMSPVANAGTYSARPYHEHMAAQGNYPSYASCMQNYMGAENSAVQYGGHIVSNSPLGGCRRYYNPTRPGDLVANGRWTYRSFVYYNANHQVSSTDASWNSSGFNSSPSGDEGVVEA